MRAGSLASAVWRSASELDGVGALVIEGQPYLSRHHHGQAASPAQQLRDRVSRLCRGLLASCRLMRRPTTTQTLSCGLETKSISASLAHGAALCKQGFCVRGSSPTLISYGIAPDRRTLRRRCSGQHLGPWRSPLDRLALEEMLAPNPTNRLHCQHSPTARFESKRAAHQAQLGGGQFWTPIPQLRGSKLHAE